MEGVNHEDILLMTDAQGENDCKEKGEAGGQAPLLIHIQSHSIDFYSAIFFSIRDDAKLWKRHKDEKIKQCLTSVSLHLGVYFTRRKYSKHVAQ